MTSWTIRTARARPLATPRFAEAQVVGTVSVVAGCLVAGAAVIVLVGWIAHLEALKSVVPGLVTMKANTAISLLLLGLALKQGRRRVAAAEAAAAGVIAVLTLIEWAGPDLRIDQLLFQDPDPHASAPGRMSLIAAVAILLISIALVLSRGRPQFRMAAEVLALLTALIGWVAISGYANGATGLYAVGRLTPLALNTAVALMVLAAGVIAACGDTVIARLFSSRTTGGRLLRRVAPVAVVVPTVGGWLRRVGAEHGLFSERIGDWLLAFGLVVLLVAALISAARSIDEAEKRQRESDERLDLAQRVSHVGIWDWNIESGRITWTQALEEIHGLVPGEFAGTFEAWRRSVHPDDRLDAEETLSRAVTSGSEWSHRFRIIRPDHEVRWVEARGRAIVDAHGEATRFVGVNVDVTDAANAEEQIKALSEDIDRFFTLSLELLCIANLDGRFVRVNPRWTTTLGWEAEEITGRPFIDFVHPGDVEATLHKLSDQAVGDEVIGFANRYRCKDGSYRWLQWSASAATPDGLIYAAARDITDLKQTADALSESEARYRGLIETQRELIVRLSPDQVVTFANDAYCKTFGFELADLIGTERWLEPIRRDDLPAVRETIAALTQPPYRATVEQLRDTVEGPHWIAWEDSGIIDEEGELVEIQLVGRDIHERKIAEQELAGLTAELEERVAARTAELAAANDELESFAFSVSHDLRTPLRGIDGFSMALLEDFGAVLDPLAIEYLTRVRQGAQRMGTLIDDLLRLSRITRMDLSRRLIDLGGLARSVADELLAAAPDRAEAIECIVADDAPAAADPQLMRIALENLLGNAFKFTSHHPDARIEFGRAPMEGETVYFVRDDGAGFDMAYADQLFAPFHRLHAAAEFPGSGIGLATVRRIIRRHGGRIWAHGEVDRGTTVYFTLGGKDGSS